jgi:SAM-dependent methyltransferase
LTEEAFLDRREHILKHITKQQKGIEIGPWFAPLAPKREGYDCLSLDVFDTERLKKNAEQDPHLDKSVIACIEPVDVIGSSTEIYDVIAARGELSRFDYIISSHNFEHLPNPIKFLQGCEQVLKPDGYLSMAIPDKRGCFDYFRPTTTIGSWLEAFLQKRDRPTLIQTFEQMIFDSRFILNGEELINFFIEEDPSKIQVLKKLRDAYNLLIERHSNGNTAYHDTHCWVFTPASLQLLLLELGYLGLTGFQVEEISGSVVPEFYVHLRNNGVSELKAPDFFERRQQLLRASIDECAYNSIYAYGLRMREAETDKLRTETASTEGKITTTQEKMVALENELADYRDREKRLVQENSFQSNLIRSVKGSLTWKIASPFWRLETRSQRKAKRRKLSA